MSGCGTDYVVSWPQIGAQHCGDGCHATRKQQAARSTLQGVDRSLGVLAGRVTQPRVDVSTLAIQKQSGTVSRAAMLIKCSTSLTEVSVCTFIVLVHPSVPIILKVRSTNYSHF